MADYTPEYIALIEESTAYLSNILDDYFPSADVCMLLGKPYIINPILDTSELASRYNASPEVMEVAIQMLDRAGRIQRDRDNDDKRVYTRGYAYKKLRLT